VDARVDAGVDDPAEGVEHGVGVAAHVDHFRGPAKGGVDQDVTVEAERSAGGVVGEPPDEVLDGPVRTAHRSQDRHRGEVVEQFVEEPH
jgi:hypothetical protein